MEALASLLGLLVILGLGAAVAVITMFVARAARSSGRPQMPPQPVAASPPGWYPAIDGSGRVMWWDGTQWSDAPGTT